MSDEDPFEEFEPVEDREGDPFEALEPPAETESGAETGQAADESAAGTDSSGPGTGPADDPFAELASGEVGPLGDDPAVDDDPFSDMQERDGDPFGDESVFERVDVETIDADSVWADITGDGDLSSSASESRYAEVSKHRYCEQCEYFSGPPEVSCASEGTEILEFTDMEHVRLLDCPVVAEQRELADEE